jgi:hypothetical protein
MITERAGTRGSALVPDDFRDTKRGKRVFILGNGPPLRDWNMDDIRNLGADTIGVNRSWKPSKDGKHKGFQGTTFHCFVSGAHAYDLCDGKVKTGVTFAPRSLTWLIDSNECGCGCKYCFVGVLSGGYSPTSFTFALDRGIMTKFAGYFGMQLAAWMNYSEIYLLGFSSKDYEGHAYDDQPEDPGRRKITRGGMRRWYRGAAEWATAKKKVIINADPDSAILDFPRMGKEELVARIAAADAKEAVL